MSCAAVGSAAALATSDRHLLSACLLTMQQLQQKLLQIPPNGWSGCGRLSTVCGQVAPTGSLPDDTVTTAKRWKSQQQGEASGGAALPPYVEPHGSVAPLMKPPPPPPIPEHIKKISEESCSKQVVEDIGKLTIDD